MVTHITNQLQGHGCGVKVVLIFLHDLWGSHVLQWLERGRGRERDREEGEREEGRKGEREREG